LERLYQTKPWMVEGMYVVGSIPKSLGEGVIVEAYGRQYHLVWQHWETNADKPWTIYQWQQGALRKVGRRMTRNGITFHVPLPPNRATA
jgi:hypothetical protein